MITKQMSVKLTTIEEGPKYGEDFTVIEGKQAVIIKEGMSSGLPSIDLEFFDADGKKYIAMLTGGIFRAIWLVAKHQYHDGGAS